MPEHLEEPGVLRGDAVFCEVCTFLLGADQERATDRAIGDDAIALQRRRFDAALFRPQPMLDSLRDGRSFPLVDIAVLGDPEQEGIPERLRVLFTVEGAAATLPRLWITIFGIPLRIGGDGAVAQLAAARRRGDRYPEIVHVHALARQKSPKNHGAVTRTINRELCLRAAETARIVTRAVTAAIVEGARPRDDAASGNIGIYAYQG